MTIGILITNTGTPDEPTAKAVRRYLGEFLSDKRVVKLPRFIWLPLLFGIILPFRAGKSAALYQKIWRDNDSPMRTYMLKLADSMQDKLNNGSGSILVEVGMNYGNPSINSALNKFKQKNISQLIVLPLYPQYSDTTTASSFDRVENALKAWDEKPAITLIRQYNDFPAYINTLADTIKIQWANKGKGDHLLISFHGLPERFIKDGDPYADQCEATAKALSQALTIPSNEWTLCYQSQFGYDKWLKPSTQDLLEELPQKGIKKLDVICPGFAIDCLETLEEIAETGSESFLAAGGESLNFIPCLNDSSQHVELLSKLITDSL